MIPNINFADKNRTLIQCGARIPLVILGAVGKTSFSEKVDSSPLEYAADFKAPSESLYCLIKIITTSDDQVPKIDFMQRCLFHLLNLILFERYINRMIKIVYFN